MALNYILFKIKILILFLAVFSMLPLKGIAIGSNEGEIEQEIQDDIFNGFEEDIQYPTGIDSEEQNQSYWSKKLNVGGAFNIRSSYNLISHTSEPLETQWKGLSRLRTGLELSLETDVNDSWKLFVSGNGFYDWAYGIKGRDEFTDDVLDDYEYEVEVGESYLAGTVGDRLNIKAGRQILVLGKSDCIPITDVLNPLDLREPGVTDIGDLRLPVAMFRVDYLWNNWNFTGSLIPEIRFNKTPEFGHDFYPFAEPIPKEDKPEHWNDSEYAIGVEGAFSGWEIAFYWANVYRDMYIDIPRVKLVSISSSDGLPIFKSKHSRVNMYGTAISGAFANFVLKAEAALFDGFEFFNDPSKDYKRIDLMGGVEYYGFKDTTIILEVANRHVIDFKEQLELKPDYAVEDEFQWAVRVEHSLLRNKLKLILFTSTYGIKGEDGAFQRVSAEYALTDAIKIYGGVACYKSGDLFLFNDISDNDRLFFEMKYWF